MEEPPPFYQFWIRRRGLSSTFTCLSIAVTVIIIAALLPIHTVNAGSCKDVVEDEEIIEETNITLGMCLLSFRFDTNHIFRKKENQQN